MQKINYSVLAEESLKFWDWSQKTPIPPIPAAVAREGAGSELRTPIMHYGVIAPVYLSIARYLNAMQLKKGMRLIELGSGSGRPLTYLKSLFPELEVWGVDYSEHGVKYAKASYGKKGVKFKHVPAQDTSLKDGYFDFVISSHVIEHITKAEGLDFMNEVSRLLKKGGYAFIGTPERRKCQDLYSKNPSDIKKHRLVPPHEHEYKLHELEALGRQVFPANNVRVDLLVNPEFLRVFKSSINKFRNKGTLGSKMTNAVYRNLRDKAPRPFFDTITRLGASQQMRKAKTSFRSILDHNEIAANSPTNKKIPENLLLVCQK